MTTLSDPPVRQVAAAGEGQITSTPARVLRSLGVNVLKVTGAKSVRRRRRR